MDEWYDRELIRITLPGNVKTVYFHIMSKVCVYFGTKLQLSCVGMHVFPLI